MSESWITKYFSRQQNKSLYVSLLHTQRFRGQNHNAERCTVMFYCCSSPFIYLFFSKLCHQFPQRPSLKDVTVVCTKGDLFVRLAESHQTLTYSLRFKVSSPPPRLLMQDHNTWSLNPINTHHSFTTPFFRDVCMQSFLPQGFRDQHLLIRPTCGQTSRKKQNNQDVWGQLEEIA